MAQFNKSYQPNFGSGQLLSISSPTQITAGCHLYRSKRHHQITASLSTLNKSTNLCLIGKVKLRPKSELMSMSPSFSFFSSSSSNKHPSSFCRTICRLDYHLLISSPLLLSFSLSSILSIPLVLLILSSIAIQPIDSLPARHLSSGSISAAGPGRVIWPNEIENNALTEHAGDFVYKQTVFGAAKQQQQPKNAVFYLPGSTGQHIRSANGRGRGRLGSQGNGAVINDGGNGFLGFQPDQFGPSLRNSAAAPPPSSTVFLWPSLSPSSPSGSSVLSTFQQPLYLCLALNWLLYQFWNQRLSIRLGGAASGWTFLR